MNIPFRRKARPISPRAIVQDLLAYQHQLDRQAADLAEAEIRSHEFLKKLGQLLHADPSQALLKPETATKSCAYVISSWFVSDCYRFLTQSEPEWMHYVTGVEFAGMRTLDRMVTFELAEQSEGYVKGDERATRDALCDIDLYGHALQGVFHSHRSRGAGSVTPSGRDKAHQDRLERGRYPVLSGIFSDDGYVRFFTNNRPFSITVYGRGIDEVGENLFKIKKVD